MGKPASLKLGKGTSLHADSRLFRRESESSKYFRRATLVKFFEHADKDP